MALPGAGPSAQQPPASPPPPQPPTFRVGVGAVRVDVTVIGKDGLPVTGLTRDDFEVREDGAVQRVQLFQPVHLSGEPKSGDDASLAIRSPEHAEQEAAREDVRLLVIFVDDYHLRAGALEDVRLRHELTRFIQTEMRPLDLFAVMGPLTPISDLGLTRDKGRLLRYVSGVQGRLGGFIPPRSPVEEAQMRLGAGDLTRVRAQVSLSALESLAVHLGGLREGRKSILYVSQGPVLRVGGDLFNNLREVIVAANRNNVTIHTFDPRQLGDARMMSDANSALSTDTGGRRIGLSNDFARPLKAVMADASDYYLLGYESPATATDGKFRKIAVDVRRGGARVIARSGYWAPRPEEVRTAAAAAAEPVVPPEITEAIDSLKDQGRRVAVEDWIGVGPMDGGQSGVTVVFETLPPPTPTPRVGAIELEVTMPDGTKGQPAPLATATGIWIAQFPSPPGRLRSRVTVKDAAGAVIDAWSREVAVASRAEGAVGTPSVYRTASVAQYRALMSGSALTPAATRRFRRTDRAVVRLPLAPGLEAPVDVQLLNRQGVPLRTMPAVTAPVPHELQVELPLGSLAQADYVLRFTVTLAGGKTARLVPFSLVP